MTHTIIIVLRILLGLYALVCFTRMLTNFAWGLATRNESAEDRGDRCFWYLILSLVGLLALSLFK